MLTEQQQTKYNTYRKAGLEPQAALDLVNKNMPAAPNKGIDNVLFGKGGFVSSVGQGVKDATVGVVQDFVDIKNNYGVGEAIVRAPLTALAGAGEGVGRIIGSGVETIDDIALGGEVGETLSPEVEKFMQSNTGQAILNGVNYIDQKTHGISGDILDSLNLLGVTGAIKLAPGQSIKQSIINSSKSVIGTVDDVVRGGSKSVIGTVDDVVRGGSKKVKASLLDDFAGEFNTIEDAMKSPKSGITDETTGIKSQFAPEKVAVPDKEFLIEVNPELGRKYLEAFKESEKSHKVDNIFTVAIKDTKTAIDDYAKKTSEVGSEIGKIKEKMEKTNLFSNQNNDFIHLTPNSNLNSIRINGLKPSENGYQGPGVYFGRSIDEAASTVGGLNENIALRIKPSSVGKYKLDEGFDNEFLSEKVINPKDLETSIDGKNWKDLETGKASTEVGQTNSIDNIIIDLETKLQKKGLQFVEGEFKPIPGKTTTFNPTDVALLNKMVRDLENVKTQGTGLEINNAIEVIDGIPSLQNITKTKSIDRLAMEVRGKLDDIRKEGLTDTEKAAFTEYSNAIGFVNDFKKGNLENKIAALLNKTGSKYENRLTEISKEIERVTGTKIEDYAMLAKILTKASREGSRNASTLKQYFDSASINSMISPVGTADTLIGKGLERLFDTDLLDEYEKAINTTVKTQ